MTSAPPAPTRWAAIFGPGYLGATVTLCLGVALLAFNAFLVSTAMPTAVTDLGGVALLSWATTVFLVFAIMGGTGAANLKGRLGARNTLIASALVFVAGSAIAAMAPGIEVLLFGRALQGLGEGVVAAICYALIPELFPAGLVSKIFGAEAVVWALAAFGGPALAGFLTETVSWRAAFAVNLPMGAVFIALALRVVPPGGKEEETQRLPLMRLLLTGGAIMLVSVGGVLTSPLLTGLCLLAAGAALFAIVRRDAVVREKLFPTDAFSPSDPVGAGLWVVLLMPVAQSGTAVYLVFALQHIWGLGPTLAGVIGAVMAISWSTVAIFAANVATRANQLRLIQAGPLLLTTGLCALALALFINALWLVIIAQVLIGASYGMSWAYLSQSIMETARPGERDRASALLPTIQSAGYGIGAAVAGLVANGAGLAAIAEGPGVMGPIATVLIVGAVVSVAAVLAARAMIRGLGVGEKTKGFT